MTPSLAERIAALEDRLRDWIGTAHEMDRLLLQDLDAIRAELVAVAKEMREEADCMERDSQWTARRCGQPDSKGPLDSYAAVDRKLADRLAREEE